jgi:hypothetical protein
VVKSAQGHSATIGVWLLCSSCWVVVLASRPPKVSAKLARRLVAERRDRKSDFPWFVQCLMAAWIDTSWHFSYLDEMAWFMGGTIGRHGATSAGSASEGNGTMTT